MTRTKYYEVGEEVVGEKVGAKVRAREHSVHLREYSVDFREHSVNVREH